MQKLRILARLTEGPATGEQLQRECQSPDPRARIHELRTQGHVITTHRLHRTNPDGSVNFVGLYRLQVKDVRQAGLFDFS
ncbi:helix-turn-helix domain-containing protein [Rhodoferax sp.]|uniref:helix-turn-helix domain-containing protein n=1 Tax=Rhodoferax sp. TaxID=50421 RepID=UPI00271B473C|nr:helix-turn-helix domain-containing protein [Rhodoferax sp.]MDO9199301.1 helix-turn-helix domain-containing protein [Rhodoferax sp.]